MILKLVMDEVEERAVERGLKQGEEKGREEGRERLRRVVRHLLRERFPNLNAGQSLDAVTDLSLLESVFEAVLAARTPAEAEAELKRLGCA